MAGQSVPYETAILKWGYSGGTVNPNKVRLQWGTAPGSHPNTVLYDVPAVRQVLVKSVMPGPGQYYAVLTALLVDGTTEEGSVSAELAFVATSTKPDGQLTLGVFPS